MSTDTQSPNPGRVVRLPGELRQWADALRVVSPGRSIPEYVLEHGQAFRSQPLTAREEEQLWSGVEWAGLDFPIKQCFYNSQMLVLVDASQKLRYVEGYVVSDHVPFPIHHGWAELDGRVIDVTMRLSSPTGSSVRMPDRVLGEFREGREYFGVRFDTRFVRKRVLETGEAGSLIDDPRRGWPLLVGPTSHTEGHEGVMQ